MSHRFELSVPVNPQDHNLGPSHAPVTLVEYGDFECPHCGAAYPIVKAIQQAMGAKLSFAYRHFPLTRIHPHAEHAAEVAEAAGEHHKFWEMHDLLFQNQGAFEDEQLVAYAERLGIDPAGVTQALRTERFQPRVRADFASGVRELATITASLMRRDSRKSCLPVRGARAAALAASRTQ